MKRPGAVWPAAVCLAAYYLAVAALIALGTRHTGGRLVYPLDDTYIHMAMAKNFALHGVWGVTEYGFSSSTSSPLWTGLLAAGCLVFGPSLWLPIALNLVVGTGFVLVALGYLRRTMSGPVSAVGATLVVMSTSAPGLTLLGMEHLLHALVTFVLLDLGAQAISNPTAAIPRARLFFLLAALLPVIRYEGLFVIALLSGMFFLQGRLKLAIGLAAAAAAPLILYGAVSVAQGWYFLPNSVLLKGKTPNFASLSDIVHSLGYRSFYTLMAIPSLWFVVLMALAAFRLKEREESHPPTERQWLIALFLAMMLLHLQFADYGWLSRYEAYLVAVGLLSALPAMPLLIAENFALLRPFAWTRLLMLVPLLCMAGLGVPMLKRGGTIAQQTHQAMHDRFLEHIQPAEFLQKHYSKSVVVVNDIGAVAFYSDCRFLDIFGLGSLEPVLYRKSTTGYGKTQAAEWAANEGAEIAVIQIEWDEVRWKLPEEWRLVSVWEVPRNVVFGDKLVGFFAIKSGSDAPLVENIKSYAASMPKEIKVTLMENEPLSLSGILATSETMKGR